MNAIVPHSHDFALDQCIEAAWKPLDQATDWDAVMANAGALDAEALTAELLAGQPYDRHELNALRVFRLQTKVRVALRCQKGLPLNAGHICGCCGQRPAHAVSLSYSRQCLACAEAEYLMPRGDRSPFGNSTGVRFDVATQTWGIAYMQEEDNSKAAAIIAHNFPSHGAAVIACHAPDRFIQLFNRVCGAGYEADETSVFPVAKLFAQPLPMTPEQWRTFCNENFRAAQTAESEPYHSAIRRVCEEYFKQQR